MENYYVITKSRPGNVYIELHPISNASQQRIIKLTDQMPSTRLPKDWALGVFLDANVFELYKKGYFTFGNKTDEIKAAAIEEGVFFGDEEELAAISDVGDKGKKILTVLKGGKRTEIIDIIKADPEAVVMVARDNVNDLTTGVINLIEEQLKVQIRIDEI